eukprot:TRINITY_DN736_c0_g1_i11.p4 TRINITY_DN736_c0_g1~~TRINITY_DN736_c0_g1_i11.p4  ORF type:complete len:138 (-),score=27.90 TRINITY_DN736_c0_g1_i11:2045-2458(-)
MLTTTTTITIDHRHPHRSTAVTTTAPASAAAVAALSASPRRNGKPKKKQKAGAKPDSVWVQSMADERERTKEDWLTLSDAQRRSLLVLEKDAMLKTIKAHHGQTCSCSVCGRKWSAMEVQINHRLFLELPFSHLTPF